MEGRDAITEEPGDLAYLVLTVWPAGLVVESLNTTLGMDNERMEIHVDRAVAELWTHWTLAKDVGQGEVGGAGEETVGVILLLAGPDTFEPSSCSHESLTSVSRAQLRYGAVMADAREADLGNVLLCEESRGASI
jgi:hypothetical protein